MLLQKVKSYNTPIHAHFKGYSLLHLSEVGFHGSKVLTTMLKPDSWVPSYKALHFLKFIPLWLISSSPSCQTLPPPPLYIVTFLGGICRPAIRASAAAWRDQTRSLVVHIRLPCPPSLLLCHLPKVLPYKLLSVDVSRLHEDAIWVHSGTPEWDMQDSEDCFILGRVHSLRSFISVLSVRQHRNFFALNSGREYKRVTFRQFRSW